MLRHAKVAIVLAVFCALKAGAAPIPASLTGPYTQDFDTLANTGTTNSALPAGWALLETGTSTRVNQQYAASNGSDNAGDVYSFGATNSAERAFGTLFSNTNTPTIGAFFKNDLGDTILALNVSYTGEQWRFGATGRGADRLDFQYSLNATDLNNGTWIDFNPLDFTSPVNSGTIGALNGNTTSALLSGTITGLNIPDGGTFAIRFKDFDAAPGADDGLGVDNFALRATIAPLPGGLAIWIVGGACLALVRLRRRPA